MINKNIQDFSDLPPIIAVDFDGTLVDDAYPKIGAERISTCNFVRNLQKLGIKSILWTSRTGQELENAINWCAENNLHFDTVNENIPEVKALTGQDTRKVYADVYLDDRNRNVDGSVAQASVRTVMKWLGK